MLTNNFLIKLGCFNDVLEYLNLLKNYLRRSKRKMY